MGHAGDGGNEIVARGHFGIFVNQFDFESETVVRYGLVVNESKRSSSGALASRAFNDQKLKAENRNLGIEWQNSVT